MGDNPWDSLGTRREIQDQRICLDIQPWVDFHAKGLIQEKQVSSCAGTVESITVLRTAVHQKNGEGCIGGGTE